MTTYVDSSVFLRVVLDAPNKLAEWPELPHVVASMLLRVESARTLERLRIGENVSSERIEQYRRAVEQLIPSVELIGLTEGVLKAAMQAFEVPLKTLDALHLASAIRWRARHGELNFATHDEQLARAAQSVGFTVLGWPS